MSAVQIAGKRRAGQSSRSHQALDRRKSAHYMRLEKYLVCFACSCLGCTCLTTLALFVLQGFHYHGFSLEAGLVRWLAGVTVSVVGGLATIVYKSLFRGRFKDE